VQHFQPRILVCCRRADCRLRGLAINPMRPSVRLLRARRVIVDTALPSAPAGDAQPAVSPAGTGSRSGSKLAAGGIAAALLLAIGFSQVWVPYYSAEARQGRARTAEARLEAARVAAAAAEREQQEAATRRGMAVALAADHAPGSMWKHVTAQREYKEAATAGGGDRPR
jgi:hypothetical protein